MSYIINTCTFLSSSHIWISTMQNKLFEGCWFLVYFCIAWFADWGPKVDVVGFCFLDLASNYEPPESLVKWLEAGSKPIYIGFGSLVSLFCWSSNCFSVIVDYELCKLLRPSLVWYFELWNSEAWPLWSLKPLIIDEYKSNLQKDQSQLGLLTPSSIELY